MTVIVSPNAKRERAIINFNGDELDSLDPRKKQIIKVNEPEYRPTREEARALASLPTEVPSREPVQPVPMPNRTDGQVTSAGVGVAGMTLKELKAEIIKTESYLADLNKYKAIKVEEMKKEIEENS